MHGTCCYFKNREKNKNRSKKKKKKQVYQPTEIIK